MPVIINNSKVICKDCEHENTIEINKKGTVKCEKCGKILAEYK